MDRFLEFLLALWEGISRVWRSPQLSSRRRHRPMISVRQLEERIVLDASFAMTGGQMVLDSFNGTSTSVTVGEGKFDVDGVAGTDDVYSFQLNGGTWNGTGVSNVTSISGNTLYVLKSALNDNLQITDSLGNNLLVALQSLGTGISGAVNADLTVQAQSINLNGNLTTNGKDVSLTGATTIGQSVVITTTNLDSAGNSGDVTFGGSISTGSATRSLTVNAGSTGTGAAGDVKFLGSLGSSTNLQGVFVTGKEVLFNDIVRVAAGGVNVNSTGSTTLNGNLTAANGAGVVKMTSGDAILLNADISAGNQMIQLTAKNDITLSQLTTTNNTASAVSVISQSGAIIDNNGNTLNIVATGVNAVTTLQAAQGIGSAKALDVNLARLNATNTASGDIQLIETNAITVQTLQTADGNINLEASGIITVDNGNSIAIQTGNMGQITLTALGTNSDIIMKSEVQSSGGDVMFSADRDVTLQNDLNSNGGAVTLKAGRNVLQNTFGSIASEGGDVTATAGAAFTMGTGMSIDAGAGKIDIQAKNNVTIESLRSEKTNGQAIRVASELGAIIDVTDAALNIDAQGAGAITTLSAATGIGALNGIEINSTLLEVSNSTSGNVRIVEADSVTIINLVQNASVGTIELTALNGAIGADGPNATIESQGGTITVTAAADVTLGQVKTANNSVNAISITSQSGSIIGLSGGTNENITTTGTSARVTLSAANGIIGEGGGDLRTAISQLSATNSASGEIRIAEKDDLTITNLKQTDTATGDITFHAGGNITVTNAGGVQAQGAGDVLLESTGASILVQGKVNAGTGTITLDAQNNVEFTAIGQTHSGGTVKLIAGQEIRGTATGTHVDADQLIATAATGITSLNTSVNTLSATNLTSGNIQIKEADNVTVTNLSQANGNGNIVLTTVNGSITVDAGSPAAVAVKTNGAGTILLDAIRVSPSSQDLTVLSSIASDAGAITLRGDQNLVLGSGVTVASQSGAISATATRGSLDMQGTSKIDAGTGTVTLLGAGNVTLGHVTTGNNTNNAIRVTSQSGAILDSGNNAQLNLQANASNAVTTLSAVAGIGALNAPLRVDLSHLSASNTGLTGDIRIEETDQIIVQSLVQSNVSGNGSISLETLAGSLTVNNGSPTVVAIRTNGTGAIDLSATGNAAELSIQSKIASVNGGITLESDQDILFGVDGDITSTTGNVSASADGKIEMSNGTQINAGSGTVSLTATGDVTLGELRTTNNTAAAISVTSTSGAIIDGNDNALNLVASSANALTTLLAATGIGTALDALEVDLARLDAVNSTSGELRLLESNAVIVENLQQSGTGNIELKTVNGSITVDSPSNGIAVHNQGTGTITLQAVGTGSDLLVLDQIEAAQGNVQLQAGRSLTFDQNGGVFTPQDVSLQAGAAINTTGSQLISAAGLTAVAATGIVLRTAVDTLSATNSTSGNIQITETDAVTVTTLKQAAGNGNVSLVTQNGSITVDNGQVPPANTVAVEAKGTGNVQLLAQGANSQLLLNSGVNAASGTVTLAAEKEVALGVHGDVTTTGNAAHVSVTSTSDNVFMAAGAEIRAGGSITLTATHGDVMLGLLRSTLTNGNAATVTSGGAIYDGNGVGLNIETTGTNVLTTLSAVSGIGAANPNDLLDSALEINVARLSASNTLSGDIRLLESNSISIVSLLQSAPAGEIELIANGLLTIENTSPVNPTVQNTGSGGITLQTDGTASDLKALGGISASGGAIRLTAGGNASFDTDGDVSSTNGDIVVTAGGALGMANGTVFHTEDGSITLHAQGTVTLGELTSHKTDASNPVTAVSVTSVAGSIQDGNGAALNVDANGQNAVTVLRSALGIATLPGDPLETRVTFLDAVNSNSGSVQILETDDVVVLNLKQLAGTGSVSLATTNGDITVADVNPVAIQTFSVGTISLNAQGLNAQGDPASLTVQGKIQSEGGAITLQGKQNVILQQNGDVTSNTGGIAITAQNGAVEVLDGRTVKTGSAIALKGETGIELRGLLQTAANGSISATATNGSILIDNGSSPAVQAGGVGTVLIDAQGANASLLVQSQVQSSLGTITLQGKNDVTLKQNGDITSSSGTIAITAQDGTLKILDGRTVKTGSTITLKGTTGIELHGLLQTTANGSISATTTNGSILVDNGALPAVQAGGVGTVLIDAQGANASLLVQSQVQSSLGTITLQGKNDVTLEQNGDITSQSGKISVTAQDGMLEILDGRTLQTGGGGSVTLEGETGVELRGLLQTLGNGSIIVTAVNGDVTVNNDANLAISNGGVGSVLLDAKGDGSSLLIQSEIQSNQGPVTLQACNDVTLEQNGNVTAQSGAIQITAQDGAVKVLNGVTVQTGGSIDVEGETEVQLSGLLRTTVNGNIAVTAVTGDILIDNGVNPAIQVSGVGTAKVDAQGAGSDLTIHSRIESEFRNIELSAQNNVTIEQNADITSQSGAVFITARDGAVEILNGRKVETSGTITVEGETGVELQGLLKTNGNGSVSVTAIAGDILVDNGSNPAIQVSGVGTVLVDAQGDGSNLTVYSRIESELRNITLQAGQDVTIDQNGDITSQSGAVFITARDGAVEILDGRKVETSGSITVKGETKVDLQGLLKTNGNGSVAVTAIAGDILVDNGSNPAIQVSGVGTVLVDASSDLDVHSRIESELRNITLQAGQDMIFGANGDVSSQSGAIFATAKGKLSMDAGTLIQSGTGRIALDAQEDVTLGEVKTGSANSVVTIPAVMITSHQGAIRDGNGTTTNITTTHVSSTVVLSAATGIGADDALETDIVRLNAEVTGAGAIQIDELDNLIVTNVRNADGSTSITAGGNMTVQSVISQTDSDANDITLISTGGGIAVQSIQGGALHSDVILQSAASITPIGSGTHVTADNLQATAGSGISLNTAVNSLNALVTGSGAIQIQEVDTIDLASVRTVNGAITITAGGTITASSVISQTDADANDITLTSTGGGINVEVINAGKLYGDVTLLAQGGAIQRIGSPTQINVTADDLNAISSSRVELYTEVNDLVGSVTGPGDFLIEEADDINLASSDSGSDDDRIQTFDGRIQIRATGNITIVDTDGSNDGDDRRQDEEIIAGGSASSSASSAGRILLQAGNIGGNTGDIIFQKHAQISAVQAATDRGAIVLIANGNFDFDSETSQITTYNGTAGGLLRTPTPTVDNLTGGNPDLVASGNNFRGTFEVQLGSGTQDEQGLELHIDWGDRGTGRYEGPEFNNQGPLNPSLEGLPGEQQLTLQHDYTIEDVQFASGNGRQNATDPLQVRFMVSHDPSIAIFANTLNSAPTTKVDGDLSLLTTSNNLQGSGDQSPLDPVVLLKGALTPIQSGASLDQPAFTTAVNTLITPQTVETLDSGVQTFRVPPVIPPRDMFLIRDPGYPASVPPPPAVATAQIVTPAIQVVPAIPVASSTTFFRDEYFQIKALSPDPNADAPLAPPERLPDDILSGDRLSQLFSQLPDGQYQIDYVLGEGNERSILKFDIRQGEPVVPGGETLDGGQLKLDDITEQLKRATDPAAIDPSTTSLPQPASPESPLAVLEDVPATFNVERPADMLAEQIQTIQITSGSSVPSPSGVEAAISAADGEASTDSVLPEASESEEAPSTSISRGATIPVVLGTTMLLRRIHRRQQEPARFSATGRLMQRLKQTAD